MATSSSESLTPVRRRKNVSAFFLMVKHGADTRAREKPDVLSPEVEDKH